MNGSVLFHGSTTIIEIEIGIEIGIEFQYVSIAIAIAIAIKKKLGGASNMVKAEAVEGEATHWRT
jgi:hypothetical protein